MKVVVTSRIPRVGIDVLEDAGLEVVGNPTERLLSLSELKDFVRGAEGILCLLLDKINADVIQAAGENLKIIANYGVGYDNIDVEAAQKRGILVTNTPSELSGQAVAEYTIALIFALLKRIVEGDEFARRGNFGGWKPEIFLGENLENKTLGLVGLGQIGSKVAALAKGLGLRVVYNKRSRDLEAEKAMGIEYLSLENLLRESDIVSLHVPLSKETEHLINSETLEKMKAKTYLINTSRGKVVDEGALVEALKSGKLAGAALDVYEYEPQINPELCGLPNVILSPHIASSVRAVRDEMAIMAAKNIVAALNGQEPPNLVKGK
ncbi:MAG TPA: D-glycerate dehydrogenase [Patescibacteria group bacterium]|nr:D-glycerate dehydrogenase [Patescibacteria group bacterium]